MRDGHIQYLHNLQVDLQDADGDEKDDTDLRTLIADKDDSISCELGIRYPTLQAIVSDNKNHQTIQVGIIKC